MSTFACTVVRLSIEPHPNGDQIEIARVGDYQSIVKKDQHKSGDLAVYIPEQALLPEWLLKEMGFWDAMKEKGALTGALGNRVRAIKLRGVLSQGIVLGGVMQENGRVCVGGSTMHQEGLGDIRSITDYAEGDDAAEFLGIVKYEPPLPSHMQARVIGVDYENTHSYDFDNLKKTPTMFEDGEQIVITEKIHGTLIQIGVVPTANANEKYYKSRVVISSKGMGAKGYILDHNDETNLYAQAAKKAGLLDKMLEVFGDEVDIEGKPAFLIGEVFGMTPDGAGVQDLTYGQEVLAFAAFDACVGSRGNEKYADWPTFKVLCGVLGVKHAPLLYAGEYSKQTVLDHTDGLTTFVAPRGRMTHIREGVVVKSAFEARNKHFGRKIAKSVSEAYLMRKGVTSENS